MVRWFLGIVVFVLAVFVASPTSVAQSRAQTVKDLKKGADFRLRVVAALTLGKLRDPSAVPPLEAALRDPHPAVRAAAAAALGKIGVPKSAKAIAAAAASEKQPSVKKQMQAVLKRLKPATTTKNAKFAVQIGTMKNRSNVNSPAANKVFRSTTMAKVRSLPGAVFVSSGGAVSAGKHKKLPMLALDGTLTKLSSSRSGKDLSYSAKVEYVIKRMPQSALKGSISGAAQALADARSIKSRGDHESLQKDAVAAAVESAMKRAPTALAAAAK